MSKNIEALLKRFPDLFAHEEQRLREVVRQKYEAAGVAYADGREDDHSVLISDADSAKQAISTLKEVSTKVDDNLKAAAEELEKLGLTNLPEAKITPRPAPPPPPSFEPTPKPTDVPAPPAPAEPAPKNGKKKKEVLSEEDQMTIEAIGGSLGSPSIFILPEKIDLNSPVEDLGFSARLFAAIKNNKIDKVGQLLGNKLDFYRGKKQFNAMYRGAPRADDIAKELYLKGVKVKQGAEVPQYSFGLSKYQTAIVEAARSPLAAGSITGFENDVNPKGEIVQIRRDALKLNMGINVTYTSERKVNFDVYTSGLDLPEGSLLKLYDSLGMDVELPDELAAITLDQVGLEKRTINELGKVGIQNSLRSVVKIHAENLLDVHYFSDRQLYQFLVATARLILKYQEENTPES